MAEEFVSFFPPETILLNIFVWTLFELILTDSDSGYRAKKEEIANRVHLFHQSAVCTYIPVRRPPCFTIVQSVLTSL